MTNPVDNPVVYRDILVELVSDNPTYGDLCTAIETVFGNNIDHPLDELSRIRSLRQTDDINIRRDTVRMLGFDVTRDFITLNDDISKIPYMFSRYYENSHSDDFWRFISFVLGRTIYVSDLYTNDYKSFYESPYGTLNVDGGDWFKTTHVDVTVDISGITDKLLANPGKSVQDRILDLFFEFAPIHLVVRRFLFSMTLRTSFSFIGAAMFDRKMLYIGGDGLFGGQTFDDLLELSVLGDSSIIEGETKHYTLLLVWKRDTTPTSNDGYSEVIEYEGFISSDFHSLVVDKSGYATVRSITQSTTASLTANYANRIVSKTITLIAKESLKTVVSIGIEGPDTVTENSLQTYVVRVFWSDGTETTTSTGSNLEWTSLAQTVDFYDATKGDLTVNSVVEDTTATIYLQYTTEFGELFNTSKILTVLNVDSSVFLSNILIVDGELFGAPTFILTENRVDGYKYACAATLSNGDVKIITPVWYLKSTAGHVATNGVVTTYKNIKNVYMRLYAEYEYRGIKQTTSINLKVIHTDEQIFDSGSYIDGPDIIWHKRPTQYNLSILWTDGQRVNAKADSWECSRFFIDETGLLNVGTVDENLWISITAHLNYMGAEYKFEKMIRAVTSEVKLDFVSIKGPQTISITDVKNLYAYAHYSDGSKNLITDTTGQLVWKIDPTITFATVDSTGSIMMTSVPGVDGATIIPVTCEYTYDNNGYTEVKKAEHYISVIADLPTLDSIVILGPDNMMELSREQFVVQALYSDGTTSVNTIPDWKIYSTETYVTAEDLCKIDRKGFLQIRPLQSSTRIVLEARYFSRMYRMLITLNKFVFDKKLPPFAAWIEGSNVIQSHPGYERYSLVIQDEATSTPRYLSADWVLEIDPTIAEVDDFGTVRLLKFVNSSAVLVATYGCGYLDPIVVSKTLSLPGMTQGGALEIVGPTGVSNSSTTQYQAFVTINGVRSDVTVTPTTTWTLSSLQSYYVNLIKITNMGVLTVGDINDRATFIINVEYIDEDVIYAGQLPVVADVEMPRYGVAIFGLDTQAELDAWVTSLMTTKYSGGLLTVSLPAENYGYFMHPVSYGLATFKNTLNDQVGGWDGASWPQNEIGTTYGPIIVPITNQSGVTHDYYVYRTDFPGLGVIQMQVNYANQ